MPVTTNSDEILSADHYYPSNPAYAESAIRLEVKERAGLDQVKVHLVNTIADAIEMMTWLGERRPVLAIDTETTGFSAYADKLRLVQIGDAMHGWAIPWDQWGGVFLDAMRNYTGPITFHNSAFDARFLSVHTPWEIPWHRTHDTMIMAHVLDPTQKVGLKPLSDRFVDRRASAGEYLLKEAFAKNKWDWATVPIEFGPYWEYGALDTVLTARLWEQFRADIRYPQVYELEMGVRRVVSSMEDAGSPIDVDYCHQKYNALSEYVEQTRQWWKDTYDLSIGSSQQLVRFFEGLGANIDRFTQSGAKSMDKAMLRVLAKEFPLANNVLQYKKAEKLSGTYFKNFLSKNVDGVLHPSIRTLGARTGRMSMTDPALQTLPKGEPLVRDAFIPREGEVLLSADYDQIEMRLMAHFSRDPGLAAAFAGETDFFVGLARQVFNDSTINKDDQRRSIVKGVAYGKAYGAGVAKMAETAGLRENVMRPSVDAFDASYPGVKRFQEEVGAIGQKREREEGVGYVMTPFGRRLPADTDRTYTLVNYLLQSHAAEILKRALLNLDNAGLGGAMLLPVHDEVIFSVPADSVEEASRTIRECMEITDGTYAVPLTVGVEGPYDRWGTKYRKRS